MSPLASSHYQTLEIESMSPARRVVFLYGLLLGQMKQASRHLTDGEIEARNKKLTKAREVVNELLVSLDRTGGGEIAENLASLYTYILKELLQIDIHQDGNRLDRLIGLVSSLHNTWSEAEQSLAHQSDSPSITANA